MLRKPYPIESIVAAVVDAVAGEVPLARIMHNVGLTMLQSLKNLEGYTAGAVDGDIGIVVDVLLDDERWIVRYLVVQAGGALILDGRRVLISPISFRNVDWKTRRFHLSLTMDKVKNSPSIETDKPVSRQHESAFSFYYDYSNYWGASGLWGAGAYPPLLASNRRSDALADRSHHLSDVHLRSAIEVRGYHINGADGIIGHVDDFVVDDETWEVRYLVIDTRNWWFGKKVLVDPRWASSVSWEKSQVHVDMSRKNIKNSPEWNGKTPISREYEARLFDHYGRHAYWDIAPRKATLDNHVNKAT